jgi:cytochrome oxidase Cu insertion factor (SCO1/SenC/PrrC family)
VTVFSRSTRGGLVLLAALTFGLSGCSSGAGPAPTPGAGSAQEATAAGSLAFTGTTLDGSTLDAATLAGTPVVLWFWAPF